MVMELFDERDSTVRTKLLESLLRQRRSWPLDEVLGSLTLGELDYCERRLQDRAVLTKRGREDVRQAIRRLRKRRR